MKTIFMAYGLCAISLAFLDFVWLSIATKNIYSPLMGDLLRKEILWQPAVLFYLLYSFGIAYLLVLPALNDLNYIDLIIRAALFGFIAYGTYNLSALAVINGFNSRLVPIDMIWGAFATMSCALISTFILKKIGV